MKLIVENLNQAVQGAISCIQANQTFPILSCLHLKAENNRLIITGSDLQTEIQTQIDAEISEPGQTCINAHKLLQFANHCGDGAIKIQRAEDNKILFRSHSRCTLAEFAADDYPFMKDAQQEGTQITLETQELTEILANIEHCAGKDDVRYYLNGVHFAISPNQLTLTASNGHRLGNAQINIESPENIDCIIPIKTVSAMIKNLKKGSVKIVLVPGQIRLSNEWLTMTSKTIDGIYPSLQNIFQTDRPNVADILAEQITHAIDAAIITSDQRFHGITAHISAQEIKLVGYNAEGEESVATINECDYQGKPIKMAFNAKYMKEAAKQISGRLTLEIDDDQTSILLSPRVQQAQYVIMPMRI